MFKSKEAANHIKLMEAQDYLQDHKTNHILHLLLSVGTVGCWIPIWIFMSFSNALERGRAKRRIRQAITASV